MLGGAELVGTDDIGYLFCLPELKINASRRHAQWGALLYPLTPDPIDRYGEKTLEYKESQSWSQVQYIVHLSVLLLKVLLEPLVIYIPRDPIWQPWLGFPVAMAIPHLF